MERVGWRGGWRACVKEMGGECVLICRVDRVG